MWNALQAKRKTGFIDGTIAKPASNSPDFENWKTVNSMIVGWIRASIKPTVKSTVTFISNAHLLWEELKQRFYVGNKVEIHQIKAQLASCKQDGEAVIAYYGRLCKLWEELKNFQASPVCSCGATMTEFVKERDEEKLHQFVMGLDDSRFGGLCTTLISMDPLPSLGVAYSKVIREEQRLSSARSREQQQEAIGFVTRHEVVNRVDSSLRTGNHVETSIIKHRSGACSHCGQQGHEKKDCWSLVGFPDWWTDRNGGGRGSSGRGRSGRGSGGGRGKGPPVTSHATSSSPSSFPEFTQDQLKVLAQIIQEKSVTGNSDKLSGPFYEDSDWKR